MRVMLTTSYIGAVMFSITIPSMVYYLQQLDADNGESGSSENQLFLGILVAAFSFG